MNKKFGFTLIELLAVVVILSVLTAIALPQYRKSIQRAEAANALINLKTIFDSAKRSYATSSAWPASLNGLDVDLFDVSENGDMGEFRYRFNTEGMYAEACRLVEGTLNMGDTYCLRAYYRKTIPNPTRTERDVYTCQDFTAGHRFQHLCVSLCQHPGDSGSECVIE